MTPRGQHQNLNRHADTTTRSPNETALMFEHLRGNVFEFSRELRHVLEMTDRIPDQSLHPLASFIRTDRGAFASGRE